MGTIDKGKKAAQGLIKNFYARNILLAVSLFVIGLFAISICLNLITRHGQKKTVPSFVGLDIKEARKVASRHGHMSIEINDSLYVPIYDGGVVLEQKPAAGTKVKSGRRIFVTTNTYHQKSVVVPYVAGYSLRQAKNNLETVGLEIARLEYVDDMAGNYVLSEWLDKREIKRGDKVETEVGSGIRLVVGRGENKSVIVPNVTGLSLREAKSRLLDSGLNVKATFDEDFNIVERKNTHVKRQTPNQGALLSPGTVVSISLTRNKEE